MDSKPKYEPPWDYSYTMDGIVSCAFCLTKDRPILVRGGQVIGICDPCSGVVSYQWKGVVGEVPPSLTEEAKTQVVRVYVLIPRLSSKKANPQSLLPSDYEFVTVTLEDGTLDLPSVEVAKGEDLSVAAGRALGSVGLKTWARPDFLETLYTAYTPRGRLAAVMMVRAWRLGNSQATSDALDWRSLETLTSGENSMSGFYLAMEPVWKMRLFKHNREANTTSVISVRVRGIAAQYIELQQGLRSGSPNLDTSLLEIMKRQVTEDEKAIDNLLAQHEVQSRALMTQKAKDAEEAAGGDEEDSRAMIKHPGEGSGAYRRTGDETGSSKAITSSRGGDSERVGSEEYDASLSGEDSDGDEDLESSDEDTDDSDDGEGTDEEGEDGADEVGTNVLGEEEDDGSPPEGFVRQGRPLSMKPGEG